MDPHQPELSSVRSELLLLCCKGQRGSACDSVIERIDFRTLFNHRSIVPMGELVNQFFSPIKKLVRAENCHRIGDGGHRHPEVQWVGNIRTKRACVPSEAKRSPQPMDTHISRRVTGGLPAFQIEIDSFLEDSLVVVDWKYRRR
ncbi:hypothetical protein EVAR_48642_1 [Eumeta japonica]|uniref:Uncharacterized protein n=1 Tax=Eumeta variegata TaxID=151549 RepID=A0A4C1XSH1_EUMVA|nr:hypothetical protein EVAR_48642_1 [Eumeta japonica]